MSGNCLAQLTQCDHGTWTIPVLGRTGIPPRDLAAEPRDEHQSCCCPRTPCNKEIPQANREKSFFIPPLFRDVPAYLSLSYSKQNQWCPGSSRKILPINDLQGLGMDFSILSSVIKNIHSPQQDPLLNKGVFPWDPAASSCSQLLH